MQRPSASDLCTSNISSKTIKQWQSVLHKFKTKWNQRNGRPASSLLVSPVDNMNDTSSINPKLEPLVTLISSPVQLQEAIQQLHQRSLVWHKFDIGTSIPNVDNSALHIHELIQLMIQERTRREDPQHHWFHIAVILACSAFQHVDDPSSHKCWAQCEMFSPHIQSLKMWDDEHSIGNSDLGRANVKIAQYLDSQGRYGEAETLIRRVLASDEKVLGPEHKDTLWTMGRYSEVERMCLGLSTHTLWTQ